MIAETGETGAAGEMKQRAQTLPEPVVNPKKRKRSEKKGGKSDDTKKDVKKSGAKKGRKNKKPDICDNCGQEVPDDHEEKQKQDKKKKKKKGGKEKGESEQPKVKKARHAYIFYGQEVRKTVRAQNPDMEFGDVSKKIAMMWKEMKPEEKQKYEDMAGEDRKRFESETKALPPKEKKPLLPKRPKNPFMWFKQEKDPDVKQRFPKMPRASINVLLGQQWRNLTDEEKIPYTEKSKLDSERYRNEMEEFKKQHPELQKPEKEKKSKKTESDEDEADDSEGDSEDDDD